MTQTPFRQRLSRLALEARVRDDLLSNCESVYDAARHDNAIVVMEFLQHRKAEDMRHLGQARYDIEFSIASQLILELNPLIQRRSRESN